MRIRNLKGTTLCFALSLAWLLAFAGCGGSSTPVEDGGFDGCNGNGVKVLTVVGDPNITLYPSQQVELKVVFLEKCVGAAAGETIEFQLIGAPAGTALSSPTAVTESNGLAKVTLTAGTATGMFQVWAKHPSDDPDGVYFSINLKAVVRQLDAVGPTTLSLYTGDIADLTVKLTDLDTSSPVRDFPISFAIVQPAPGDAAIPAPQVATNLSGLAVTAFQAGTTVTSYQVVAEGTSEQVGRVTFQIQVRARANCTTSADCAAGFVCVNGSCMQSGGEECTTDDQCPEGYHCENNLCRPDGTLPDSCTSSEDCPQGYYCENHRCYPCDDTTTTDPNCQNGGGCQTDQDCPPGFHCVNGVCYPDNPDDVVIPELGGTWYTKHYFDLEAALPNFAQTISGIISKLNQAINYCDITGIGFIDDLLCDLIDEYVPDWVGTLISILDNIGNMLKELRAEGTMKLTHLNPRELISATEVWNKILIRYLDACCEGQPAGCNPYNQPDFPDCATIDINREDLEMADVGLQVYPFTAKVSVDDSGAITKYTLAVDPRRVEIELSKFVGFLVDLLCQIFLGYDDLNDALADIIDCEAIQDFVDSLWPSWLGSPPDIVQTCENFKPTAGDLLRGLLDQIGVGWKLLKFSGWATIATEGDPPYGVMLGLPNYEQSGDGHWDGSFTIVFEGDITGAWFGER